MGLFRKKKELNIVDFTKMKNTLNPNSSSVSEAGIFNFLDSNFSSDSQATHQSRSIVSEVSELSEIRINLRKITSQIEDHSNEVYRLMQRIELLERKVDRLEGK